MQPLSSLMDTVRRRQFRGFTAFTLVELLVIVAVVGILAGLLLPVLAGAKSKARAIVCLNHHRQLILACMLYTGDHKDALPYNLGAAETKKTVSNGTFLNWVNNVMSWELDQDNTNEVWVRKGGLGPYLSGDVNPFRCPSDHALSDVQAGAGWDRRLRSVSMNAMVGNAGDFTKSGVNTNNPHYKQFFKLGDVPRPSEIFVFIEEHPDSIGDGYFLNHAYSGKWHDLPASYHDGASHLAFADGHVERHRWSFQSTKPAPKPDTIDWPISIPTEERDDFLWLRQHTSIRK